MGKCIFKDDCDKICKKVMRTGVLGKIFTVRVTLSFLQNRYIVVIMSIIEVVYVIQEFKMGDKRMILGIMLFMEILQYFFLLFIVFNAAMAPCCPPA